jgi:predicted metalloprotease
LPPQQGQRPYDGRPYRTPHPQRKRPGSTGIIVLGGLLGAIAAAFVLVVLGAALLKSSIRVDTTSPVAFPTYTPSTSGQSEQPTPEPERPSATPTESAQEQEPEQEVTRPALNTTLENNTLYKAGALPKVNCPGGSANIYNHAQLKTLILKTSKCLDKVWSQALAGQGIEWRRPGYAIAARSGRGACGDYPTPGSIVPYYCPRNYTIYASTSAMSRGSGNAGGYGELTSWHGGIVSMMAHEYGHHVQQLSGLSDSWWQKTLRSTSKSGKLALSRRFELQATCFGGMFMRAASATYPVSPARRQVLYFFYSRVGDWPGYPRDHGSPANNNRWFRQGFEKNKTFQCNTWLAPSDSTS